MYESTATAALATHFKTIDTDYGVYADAFVAACLTKAQELQHCKEVDVPKGALRLILAGTEGMEF